MWHLLNSGTIEILQSSSHIKETVKLPKGQQKPLYDLPETTQGWLNLLQVPFWHPGGLFEDPLSLYKSCILSWLTIFLALMFPDANICWLYVVTVPAEFSYLLASGVDHSWLVWIEDIFQYVWVWWTECWESGLNSVLLSSEIWLQHTHSNPSPLH